MVKFTTTKRRLALCATVAALVLGGCAAQTIHREGMDLLEQGRYEEALSKLGEASRMAPDRYRKDYLQAQEEAANRFVANGNAARAAERFDIAEQAYRQALRVDPGYSRAVTALEALNMDKRHAVIVEQAEALFKRGDVDAATARLKEVFLENPNNGKALQLQKQINERTAKDLHAAPALRANFQKPVTLQFRDANLRMVLESISKTTGINILLDKDVRPDLKATIFVKGTSVGDTIDLILMQNQLEKKVLSDNTIFIYPNVPAKTKDYQDLKVRSFHLVYADVKQMQAMIKTILKTRDLFIHEKTNSLIMRDTPEAIRLAEKMIADQDIPEPEIMLEVEVLEVTRTRLSQLGIKYPDQAILTPQVAPAAGGGAGSFVVSSLGKINKDNLLLSPIPSLTVDAHLDQSQTNVLASPRVRVRNREKAKILIGNRVPVMTNSVTPVATGAPVVTGTVSYLDVGLKLDVEPDIHSDGEVGIKVNMEVSSITRQVENKVSGTIAYEVGTRTAQTILRLKDGETQVLAGLINDQDRRTANMIPGLGQLPLVGRLFGTHGTDATKSEIVLSITPRIVGRTKLPDANLVEFWTGTENNLRSAPINLQTGSVSVAPAVAQTQPARTTPLPPRPVAQPQSAAPQTAPMSFNWQGPAQAKVGDRFTLTLYTQAAQPVRNLNLQVNFDPLALKAVEAAEGNFMRQQNVPAQFTRDINQSAGQITLGVSGTEDKGGSGAGSIALMTFEVIAPSAPSEITVARAAPAGIGGDALPFALPAPYTLTLTR